MFAVNIAIHQFCLQLTISCGFAVNSSYRDIIDYRDYLQRISQNIAIMYFWLLHSPTHNYTKCCAVRKTMLYMVAVCTVANIMFHCVHINCMYC